MLLDRRRINKWAKWMALVMAVVFALSFVGLGVGSGTGLDFSALWGGGGSSKSASAQSPEDQIKVYEETLAKTPNDYTALLGISNQYLVLKQGAQAAPYLEKALTVQPESVDVLTRLAGIYTATETADSASAVRVLNQLTKLEPNNAQAFLQLGVAQRSAGNSAGAILAWNRFLELDPSNDLAGTVKTEIEQLKQAQKSAESTATAQDTTSTAGAGSTTTSAP